MRHTREVGSSGLWTEVAATGWMLPVAFLTEMSEGELRFVRRQLSEGRSPEIYIERLERVGFVGLSRVLDIGCGIGQWAASLSTVNELVLGIDLNVERLAVASALKSQASGKVLLAQSQAEALPIADGAVDGAWVYSVLNYCSDIDRSIAELHRAIRPNGQVYFCYNSWPYYVGLLLGRRGSFPRRWMMQAGLRVIFRSILRRNSEVFLTKASIRRRLSRGGFHVVADRHEGGIGDADSGFPEAQTRLRFHRQQVLGFPGVREVVALRR